MYLIKGVLFRGVNGSVSSDSSLSSAGTVLHRGTPVNQRLGTLGCRARWYTIGVGPPAPQLVGAVLLGEHDLHTQPIINLPPPIAATSSVLSQG